MIEIEQDQPYLVRQLLPYLCGTILHPSLLSHQPAHYTPSLM